MLELIKAYYDLSNEAIDKKVKYKDIVALPVRENIGRSKYIPENEIAEFDKIMLDIRRQIKSLQN